jgi:hypothetical protein
MFNFLIKILFGGLALIFLNALNLFVQSQTGAHPDHHRRANAHHNAETKDRHDIDQ